MDRLKQILIVKTSALGDIIHTYPVISYLKEKFPYAAIDWMVEAPFASLVESHPYVRKAIKINFKAWKKSPFALKTLSEYARFNYDLLRYYSLIIDLQGNMKSALFAQHAWGRRRVGFGLKSVWEWPNYLSCHRHFDPPSGVNVRLETLSVVQQYFKDTLPFKDPGIRLRISAEEEALVNTILASCHNPRLICPGAQWINKCVPAAPLTTFLQSLDGDLLLLWGSPAEKAFVETLQKNLDRARVLPKISLPALQNLMSRVREVVAMDSMPLHLAGTTTTPTFSFFGPTLADKFRPFGAEHRSFQGNCPYQVTFNRRCNQLRSCKTGACLREVDGTTLINAYKI